MRKPIFCFLLAACSCGAWAEGPGSRLLTTPEVPQPTQVPTPSEPSRRSAACEAMRNEARERCLREQRERDIEQRTVGAGATGMGSGAGSGAVSGPGASPGIGGGTPR